MTGQEIREKFLKFFEERGHKVLPGSSLIPTDPTVLLTLAGMLQFKPIFLGVSKPTYPKVATVQKCVRLSDIEKVGKTSRHHTFFEMLGNFSFGDYFKKEAILWAWELLTYEFKLPESKLLVAVYEKDEEAYEIWEKIIGVPPARIYKLGEENNFWAAGPTGPCGPCSEIYFDLGEKFSCGKPDCKPSCDCDRYLELWNLVFIEFNRNEKGQLIPLPNKNIDTGMGLERITSVLQGVTSNFDTDLLKPLMDEVKKMAEVPEPSLESLRIVADHSRAMTYLIGDGVMPSNEGRGYVLRRIIRRAVRHGQLLGIKEPFLYKLSGKAIDLGKDFYPELLGKSSFTARVIKMEEEHFGATLEQGMKLMREIIEKAKKSGTELISGAEAFKLHDTYGFPLDLTKEIVAAEGLSIDEESFAVYMEKQKEKARLAGLPAEELEVKKLKLEKYPPTKFVGYEKLEIPAKVLGVVDNFVVLDKTPFYPEGGGQIGDTGSFKLIKGQVKVSGTYGDFGGVIVHQVEAKVPFKEGAMVTASVDEEKRNLTAKHHTATHLLHKALREVLGSHVKQSGSLVEPERLRFDFTHFERLSDEEIKKIENLVNQKIKENIKVETLETTFKEAEKMGAIALFGEKYGEKVRVLKIGKFSLELCGGTHVKKTGEIEYFKIISESAVASGVRRIEAVTSSLAKDYVTREVEDLRNRNLELFKKAKELLFEREDLGGPSPIVLDAFEILPEEANQVMRALKGKKFEDLSPLLEHLRGRNEGLIDQIKNLGREIEKLKVKKAASAVESLISKAIEIKGIKILAEKLVGFEAGTLREIADRMRDKLKSCVVILASVIEDRIVFVSAVTEDLKARGFHAGNLVAEAARIAGGRGGGKATLAEGGGKDVGKVDEALKKVKEICASLA